MDATHLAGQATQSGKVTGTTSFNIAGNNSKNYGASYGAGVGVPVINNGPNRPSVGVGATVNGGFARVEVRFF